MVASGRYDSLIEEKEGTILFLFDCFRSKVWLNLRQLRKYPKGLSDIRAHAVRPHELRPGKIELEEQVYACPLDEIIKSMRSSTVHKPTDQEPTVTIPNGRDVIT